MLKNYLKKIFKIKFFRTSPMKSLKLKALKIKKEKEKLPYDHTYTVGLTFSFLFIFIMEFFFIFGVVFLLSINSKALSLLANHLVSSTSLIMLSLNVLIFIFLYIFDRRESKYFDYSVSLDDIKNYVKSFEKDKQKLVIEKIVGLLSKEGTHLAHFKMRQKYLDDNNENIYNPLSNKEKEVVKCIQKMIVQEEEKIILNKENIYK